MLRKVYHYLWDNNVVLHEWVETKEEARIKFVTWVYEDGSFIPVAKILDNENYSIVSDYLGTPIQAYSSDGSLAWERELDIYGRVRKENLTNFVPFLYQGQYFDVETGLAYNRFRYYDPSIGSYISQDPIGMEGGISLYSYVFDLNNEIDPFGESPSSIVSHHLIPQEMMKDSNFMRQLRSNGIKDTASYIHRQTAGITESLHKSVHKGPGGGSWNQDFKNWYSRNPNFSKKDLQKHLREMMQNHNIPRSSRNFSRKYGRKNPPKIKQHKH